MNSLKKFDIFPKYTDPDVKVKTNGGAILSLIAMTLMSILFLHELYRFIFPRIYEDIAVDSSRVSLARTMNINFNISIQVPCGKLFISAYDAEGNAQSTDVNDIKQQRIDENGFAIDSVNWIRLKRAAKSKKQKKEQPQQYCGKCYGALPQGKCCNSCEDVINAFKAKGWGIDGIDRWQQCIDEGYADLGKESCNVYGDINVAHISGFLYFALEDYKVGDKHPKDISRLSHKYNLTHTINYLEFGPRVSHEPGPLDGLTVLQEEPGLMQYNYDLEVVPTKWFSSRGFPVSTYKFHPMITQKNFTEKVNRGVPGIFLNYNLAPISLVQYEVISSPWKLITSVCAIVGGCFTCVSLADQIFFRTLSSIEGKRQIGKAE
ncbi:hypothetical protein TVAG_442240 [Trichomonas vaginalis G3]|uniref:Uncharacterized protein n=1 Tax=Trichomonas vaginalis (strain ATCC PRA-98 / G3) TaxID=412133 RepID=A2F1W7_TRIV3|nr:vesicle-mediated transport [Trichomonas vaginalis G3]EAY01112.1 hypothetical protein TVAG_442240 [Trichomonas vaginalis G3]KAI5517431.1 vesicle-mediated transport [Trichomonas vaginalis G3]|eukprot:XP_001313964.1 hypothetical protein [Trichomonas vaginalis G3]